MKFLKYTFILSSCLLMVGLAQAKQISSLQVPFQKVKIAADSAAIVNYEYNNETQMIHCYDSNNVSDTAAIWSYKEEIYNRALPVTLGYGSGPVTKLADPSGHIFIENYNDEKEKYILLTCEFVPLA